MGESRLSTFAFESRRTAEELLSRDASPDPLPGRPCGDPASLDHSRRAASSGKEAFPLSFAQRRLWFLDQLVPGSPLYNMSSAFRLRGTLDIAGLRAAINSVVARHEALRTGIRSVDGSASQIVNPPGEIELRVQDLSRLEAADAERNAMDLVRQEVKQPFHLNSDPLLRTLLVRLRPDEHLFVLTVHHIVFDEWSLRIFLRELAAFYRGHADGHPLSLPRLPLQYVDYAIGQRKEADLGSFDEQASYWRQQLGGNPPAPELPLDHPRGPTPTFEGGVEARQLPPDLSAGLKAVARKSGASLFMVLLAAFKTLVHRYTQLDDITIAAPIAGRNRLEFEELIGLFVNTLPLRTRFSTEATFEQLLVAVRTTALQAFANQDVPFERIVEELRPERSLLHLPFTRLMFVLQNDGHDLPSLPGLQVEALETGTDTAKFDATITVQEGSRGLRVRVEYNSALFEAATMRRMLAHFENLLRAIAANPQQRLGELQMISETERRQLLCDWNQTSTDFPRDKCVHELFEAQVERAPDAVAVTFPGQSLTYRELNERANQVAGRLQRLGVGPEVPVAVLMERSAEMIVAWLAILKAGGAYVPIHAEYPRERLEFMLADASAPILLTQEWLLPGLPAQRPTVFCLDSDWNQFASESTSNLKNAVSPESLAYIMYTSGSTGTPKGVAIPHRAINRLVLNTNYVRFDATDRVAQISNAAFDAATFEVWGALLNGGRLVGIPSEVVCSPTDLARELRAQGVTATFLTTAVFNQLAREAPGAFETLRTVIAGGEALDPKWVRAVLQYRPPARLLNGYGPTENTTFSCCQLIREVPEDAANVPIGRPISNTQAYILDPRLQPVPIGIPGELFLGGAGLARGYWKRPELNAKSFIANPYADTGLGGELLYRTGDRARYLVDGSIEFLGRVDNQVKVRGFRIELGEIETLLRGHEGIGECAITVCGQSAEDKRLVAYFAPAGKRVPTTTELRAYLERKLPSYMIPSLFIPLTQMPLTSNGKVNRDALPKPDDGRPKTEKAYLAPQDEVERRLTGLWEEILGVKPIGIEDKFFELGGHSLLAVRVIAAIEKSFGKRLRVATLFLAPSIQQLAAIIRGEVPEDAVATSSSVVELQPRGTGPALNLVHGAGGGMFWGYTNLARHLGSDRPIRAFKSRSLDGRDELDTVEEMAAQYVADLQRVQPRGPYYLGGYCFGGIIAHEMARQLEARGERVGLLALFNCSPPNSRYTAVRCTPAWAARFARNLVCWAKYFWQWTPTQRRGFFRWKWGRLKRHLNSTRGVSSAELFRAEAENFVDLSSFSAEQQKVWIAHISALVRFHPGRIAAPVCLFRSPGHPLWCSFAKDYGWGDYTSGGVTTMMVPVAHEKILEEPCVENVAASLKKGLAAAETVSDLPAVVEREVKRERNDGVSPLEFWKKRLEGAPELLELPTDHARPAVQSRRVGTERCVLGRNVAEQARSLAQRHELGYLPVLVAVVKVLLQRYSGQSDLVVAASLPSRVARLADVSGEDPVLLRTNLEDDPEFSELLGRIHAACADGARHRLPFTDLLAALRPTRDSSYQPLAQVLCTAERIAKGAVQDLEGTRGGPTSAGFDLQFHLVECEDETVLRIDYAEDWFEPATIRRMLGHVETLLESATNDTAQHISKLPLLTAGEKRVLLDDWTATEQEFPEDKTLWHLFEEQARRTPEAEALVCGAVRLTYRELLARAARVASRLRDLGVREEALVGICLGRSAEMIAGILGTLQAGGAYVPLDPAYPKERLAFMLADAKVRVLLTQRSLLGSLPSTEARVLCVEDIDFSGAAAGTRVEDFAASAHNLAYVIYTSGSTGQPKGVALEHRGAVALVSWAKSIFQSGEISGVLAATSICFDLSVFEIFVPLCCGGKIILADHALALPGLPAANEVRLVNTVPSAIRELLRVKGLPSSVEVINLAGEPLAKDLVEQIYRETRVKKVYDLYGPTETTTYSTFTLRQPGLPATIGRPLANEQVYLLDKHLQLAPIGVPGELYIGGVGLARGYLNRPELTAERFVAHPFRPGLRLYKTGDLARWRADGNLEFLGRIDHQVKVRGFRIELGEIESVLKRDPRVREAVVLAREDQPGNRRLVGYVVLHPNQAASVEELRLGVREKLPDYMLPSAFVFLPELPLTPNGKVDRKALPPPEQEEGGMDAEATPSLPPTEAKLAAIWREVLHLRRVGVNDNFFDLGGHSLLAIQAIARIRDAFQVELPLTGIFDAPTIAKLSEGLTAGRWKQADGRGPALECIPRGGALPVSFVQERLWFLEQMEPGRHAYHVPAALRLKGNLDLAALEYAVNEVARRHEALRTTFAFNEAEGVLTQNVAPRFSMTLPVSSLPAGATEQQWLNAEAQRPFDLARGPLFRAGVLRLGPTEHILLVVFHHTVADGWSLGILFHELEQFYAASLKAKAVAGRNGAPLGASELPTLAAQPADQARWQRRSMQEGRLDQELDYWRAELSGAPAAVDLPLDFPAGSGRDETKAGCERVEIVGSVVEEMQKVGRRQGATPFAYLMTALAIVLHKWTRQNDLVVGTVVAGRSRRELEAVIGCFVNFLPIRAKFAGSETGLEILAQLRERVLEAQAHQECPFEKIVEAINPERKLNQNPLYNVALLFQNYSGASFHAEGLEAEPEPVMLEAALLDLRFEVEHLPHGLALQCEYRSAVFENTTIEQLLHSFCQVVETLVRRPQTPVADFKLAPALEAQSVASRSRRETRTVAIAGTFTVEPLEEPLRYWMKELEVPVDVEFAPYNQVFQQLLDAGSLLSKNARGLNVLLVRLEDWKPESAGGSAPAGQQPGLDYERTAKEFTLALKTALSRPSAPFLVCLCPPSNRVAADAALATQLAAVEKSLATELASLNGVYVVSPAELAALYPVADYYDSSADELGRVPYTPVFFTALATMVARKFHALCRPACKVIVLDCDQTLWAGVSGEDGPQGIRLDPPRRALQEFMRAQYDAGRLLCACSKNSEEEVLEVFAQRTEMPLRREHFAAWRVNWLPKSENLKSLARELKLGLDSFVFIDDNPVECAEVEANCPDVLTLQLPEDPEQIPAFLAHSWVFDHLKLTSEDRHRGEMYRQNREREQLRSSSLSLADFLAGLDLRIRIKTATEEQLSRAAQLTQRTNQFNFTTRRRTESEIAALRPRMEVLAVTVTDRFGDYGMVGLILFETQGEALVVDTFLLSCRVLGRGVEHRMLARLGEHAQQRRLKWVDVHFDKTARNKPAIDFLDGVGSQFRQPLNGGFLYRFPAGFAAGVGFDPAAAEVEPIRAPGEGPSDGSAAALPSAAPAASAPKFTRCRAIALGANDAAQIHQAVEARSVKRTGRQAGYAPPRTQLERQLCGLWQNLLRVEKVGIGDNFFELGGHSLLAVRLFAQVEKLTGRKFPLVTLFQAPTIEQLARLLSHRDSAASRSVLVPIQPDGAKPPLFLVHGAGGDVLWGYANLAALMPADQPIYGIKSRGQLGLEECTRLEEMASFYLQEVRAFQREGPYFFGGYCFGGNVAYEMARQLRAQGEEVGLVALMDSAPANAGYEAVHWWHPAFPWRFARNFYFWLEDFMRWKPNERRRFAVRKARALGRKIMRRLRLKSGPSGVDLEEVVDPVFFPENELKLWQIHLNALVEHVEQPYPGAVVLLRTRGEPVLCSFAEDFCWSRLARGGVSIKRIPGSHENIFMEPNVQHLARELTAALSAANTSKTSTVPTSP